MKEIYVFDIDGCVLPQIFPNITENNSTSEKVIKESLERSKNVILYDEFVEFYEKNCINAYRVVFITGRKRRSLGEMTDEQLSPLRKTRTPDIIYYPEDKDHVVTDYFDWKVEKVQEVIKKDVHRGNDVSNGNLRKDLIFKIYDDMPEYFSKIQEIAENQGINVVLTPIKGPEDWKDLINK